jgi:Uma2 family endonuclease
MITSLDQLNSNGYYTYADYLMWRFKERVELLRGRLFEMAAPNVKHQRILVKLTVRLENTLEKKPCSVFVAPFDVRLPLPSEKLTGNKTDTVVQPDLCVICDESKLDKQGCVGAPDLVVEILSPGNSKKEMRQKYFIYEAAGVREYWIFDPEHNAVFVYFLDKNTQKFVAVSPVFTDEDVLTSCIFPDLKIDLSEVFPAD